MLHKKNIKIMFTTCHYKREQKKIRSYPFIAILEEVLKIQA